MSEEILSIHERIEQIRNQMAQLYLHTNQLDDATQIQRESFNHMYAEKTRLYELLHEMEQHLNGKSILEHLKKRELGRGRMKHYSSPLFRVYGKKKGGNDDELRKHLEWMQSIPSPNAPYGKDILGNPKNSMGWSPYEHFSGYG